MTKTKVAPFYLGQGVYRKYTQTRKQKMKCNKQNVFNTPVKSQQTWPEFISCVNLYNV